MKGTFSGLALALALASAAEGEVLVFREGGQAVLPIKHEGADVLLDTPMGLLRFPRADFREIRPGGTPGSEWERRRSEASRGGASARRAAALWALDQGLVSEAESSIREAHAASTDDETTKRLVSCLDRLEPGPPDPDLPPLLRGLPRGARLARGPHVLLIHQHSDEEAAERVAFLEQIIKAYYLDFATLGFDLPAPERKLPSVWFAKKADYVEYLRAEGATAFLTTRGYHHQARGLVVAYDCRDDTARRDAAAALLGRRAELDRLDERIDAIRGPGRIRIGIAGEPTRTVGRDEARAMGASLRRQVDRQQMQLELGRREIDLGIAAHETVHQLVAATRLANGHDRFPEWLHEGIAMQFEAIRGGRWAGLASPSPLRLDDYRKIAKPPPLEPTLRDASVGRGYNRDRYARAWALVYHLRRNRTSKYVAILDRLRLEGTPRSAGSIAVEVFGDKVDGDLEREQAQWHEAINALVSPKDLPPPEDHPH